MANEAKVGLREYQGCHILGPEVTLTEDIKQRNGMRQNSVNQKSAAVNDRHEHFLTH